MFYNIYPLYKEKNSAGYINNKEYNLMEFIMNDNKKKNEKGLTPCDIIRFSKYAITINASIIKTVEDYCKINKKSNNFRNQMLIFTATVYERLLKFKTLTPECSVWLELCFSEIFSVFTTFCLIGNVFF